MYIEGDQFQGIKQKEQAQNLLFFFNQQQELDRRSHILPLRHYG